MKNTTDREFTRVTPAELAPLIDFSARLGADPLLAQDANGNTSIKVGGTLWIKASGKAMARAMQEEMFVPVDLAGVREVVHANAELTQAWASDTGLRPSTETPMHAILRHNVVLHVHSINCIAWAVRLDARERLAERLEGLHWQWVPYVASGVPIAREVKKRMADAPETDIWILGNHGLVVCGENCESTEALLQEVERRLAVPPRMASSSETAMLSIITRSTKWRCPAIPALQTLGADAASCRMLKGGCLYPSQSIFLGTRVRPLPYSEPISRFAEFANGPDGVETFVIVEGAGVIVNKGISSAAEATLIGLAQVLQRVEESAPLRYLTPEEIAGVRGV